MFSIPTERKKKHFIRLIVQYSTVQYTVTRVIFMALMENNK